MALCYATEIEAEALVERMSRMGSSITGRYLQYPLCWGVAYAGLWAPSLLGTQTFPRTKGTEHLKVPGPLIIVSNHRHFYDYLWIAMCTRRHIRPLQKDVHFQNRLIANFLARGGALPIPQAPKSSSKTLDADEKERRRWLIDAVQAEFVRWITAGRAGLVFGQGTRKADEQPIGELRQGLLPLFNFQNSGVDPLVVVVGLTAKALVAKQPVRLSELRAADDLLICLRERMQWALDEAIELGNAP